MIILTFIKRFNQSFIDIFDELRYWALQTSLIIQSCGCAYKPNLFSWVGSCWINISQPKLSLTFIFYGLELKTKKLGAVGRKF